MNATLTPPSPQSTLASLATERPEAVRVFQRHGLDFCCNGRRTLADACREAGLDPEALVREIRAEAREEEDLERWDQRALPDLIDHILARFHERHRADVPGLVEMARKVEQVHADKPSCPRGLTAHLERVSDELEQHMQKEEQILFPLIRRGAGPQAAMPVQVMEMEHEDHGRNLAHTRELTTDLTPPPEACTTWRALYQGLAELEREVMQHVHLENNVLFPRALRG